MVITLAALSKRRAVFEDVYTSEIDHLVSLV